jgi:hypothetical protein
MHHKHLDRLKENASACFGYRSNISGKLSNPSDEIFIPASGPGSARRSFYFFIPSENSFLPGVEILFTRAYLSHHSILFVGYPFYRDRYLGLSAKATPPV